MSITVKHVSDIAFNTYGRILTGIFVEDIIEKMDKMPIPEQVEYVPCVEELEMLPAKTVFQENVYGSMPIQIGYCNGHNKKLNGLEYHRSSEINVAATDLILLLGKQQDIKSDFTYETSKVEAFFIPRGTTVLIYATTLHYAPCSVNEEGFRCVVVLPEGTNLPLKGQPKDFHEDILLTARNKWLIAHEEAHIPGAFVGLQGNNIEV